MTDLEDLDALLAMSRTEIMAPSTVLTARVLADADRLQPRSGGSKAGGGATGPGVWAMLAAVFGGGGVLAGMGTAAVAGLYLGFVQPASFLNLADALLNATQMDSLDLMPGIDALLTEE